MPAAPPEPIDGRRTATEPTAGAPPAPPAATHRHRVPDPTPHVHTRHDRTTPLPHECRTNQCRPSQSKGDAPRRSPPPTIRRAPPPTPPAATHRHRAPDATPTSTRAAFCSSELPHECLTGPCRPSQSKGDAPRRSPPPTIRRAPPPTPPAATHRHRAPDATPTSTRATTGPRRAHGGAPRAPDEPPLHARPSDRRADAPVHSAAPVDAPRPCSAPVCRRSAEALGTPVSRVL